MFEIMPPQMLTEEQLRRKREQYTLRRSLKKGEEGIEREDVLNLHNCKEKQFCSRGVCCRTAFNYES